MPDPTTCIVCGERCEWRCHRADCPPPSSSVPVPLPKYSVDPDIAFVRSCDAERTPDELLFKYQDRDYPDYIRRGNACQFILPVAQHFCRGVGLDVGAGKWPFPGATPVDMATGGNAMNLPDRPATGPNSIKTWDYIFSSHCLEHLENPVAALEHWKLKLRVGGTLFLYLPHPEMIYWLPQNNRKHLHSWEPREMHRLVTDLGFRNVLHSGRDLVWSFSVVGFKRYERDV